MERPQENRPPASAGVLRAMAAVVDKPELQDPAFRQIVTLPLIEAILYASRRGNKSRDIYEAIARFSPEQSAAAVEAASVAQAPQKTLVFPSCIRDNEQIIAWGLTDVVERLRTLERDGAIDECMRIVKEKADKGQHTPEGGVRVIFVAASAADEGDWVKRIQTGLNSVEKSRVVAPKLEDGRYYAIISIVREGQLRRMKISGASKSRVGHLARYVIARRGDDSYRAFAEEGNLHVETL